MAGRHLANVAVVACTFSATAVVGATAEPRAVIELFTSQGCSSCPAADKLLGQLASDPSVIPISVPIDYWDYLGWKDTLADPRHTRRQRGYAKARGDREVYTPQVVVNGGVHALGSDRDAIEKAITKSRDGEKALTLPVTLSASDGRLMVAVSGAPAPAGAEVWICGLAKSITVAITRGENRGKTVTYFNVARRWLKVDAWHGAAKTWAVPLHAFDGADIDGAAVFVQAGSADKPGVILGAAMAAVR